MSSLVKESAAAPSFNHSNDESEIAMSKSVTIQLSQPILVHGGTASQIVVREPLAKDYFSLGEPSVIARSKDGSFYSVESPEVLNAYVERCVVEPKDPLLLSQLSLADAMKIKGVIHGFFTEAQDVSFGKTATSSSAPSDG